MVKLREWKIAGAVLLFCTATAIAAFGSDKPKLLHTFTGGEDGGFPNAALTSDGAGNLYGTTILGGITNQTCGTHGCGTVFKLSPNADGSWSEEVLYSFTGGPDGDLPYAGVIFDNAGNLYGTTVLPNGGLAFELSPGPSGWTEKVIHDLDGGPWGLVFDKKGNLYGTTRIGGTYNEGTVFMLVPTGDSWSLTTLYSFAGNQLGTQDGANPQDVVPVLDDNGNLYGTTLYGGTGSCFSGCGTVWEVSPTSGGSWAETLLDSFQGADGCGPDAGLAIDDEGRLFGTCSEGGTSDEGMVFALRNVNGTWKEKLLYSFSGTNGAYPQAPLLVIGRRLYGTTDEGGANGSGAAFELDCGAVCVEHVLASGSTHNGESPQAGLISDSVGNLYGDAQTGGFYGSGTVFEIAH